MMYEATGKSHLDKTRQGTIPRKRQTLNAVKTMPTNELLVESSELPLHLKRTKLSLKGKWTAFV